MRERVRLWTWGLALAVSGAVAVEAVLFTIRLHQFGGDGRAYWLTGHRAELYGLLPRDPGAFLYSPAFAQVVRPLTWLPWAAFTILWCTAEAALFAWLLRPLGPRWGAVAFLWCVPELLIGNINALLALSVAVGLTRPAWWAFPALTKIAPAQGFLWFAVRREWRQLAVATAATAGIAAVSLAIAPGWWAAWFRLLRDAPHHSDVTVRVVIACAITVASALTNRRWPLAVAVALATPVFTLLYSVTVLTAIPRLRAQTARAARDGQSDACRTIPLPAGIR
jgi:hypothetical protein